MNVDVSGMRGGKMGLPFEHVEGSVDESRSCRLKRRSFGSKFGDLDEKMLVGR